MRMNRERCSVIILTIRSAIQVRLLIDSASMRRQSCPQQSGLGPVFQYIQVQGLAPAPRCPTLHQLLGLSSQRPSLLFELLLVRRLRLPQTPPGYSMDQTYTVPADSARELYALTADAGGALAHIRYNYAPTIATQAAEALLMSVFFGLYTILAVISIYLLCRKRLRSRTKLMMLLVITAIYCSTTIYWVVVLNETFRQFKLLVDFSDAGAARADQMFAIYRDVFPDTYPGEIGQLSSDPSRQYPFEDAWRHPLQDCAGTAVITLNVVLGDAIVWWRAWVLWSNSRSVRLLCVVLLLGTTSTAVVVTTHGCSPPDLNGADSVILGENPNVSSGADVKLTMGTLFTGDKWGLPPTILSLVTNVTATGLIAYKAWMHRKLVGSHLRTGSTRTRVESVLALLVESGIVYCVLWVFVVVYQTGSIAEQADNGIPGVVSRYVYGFHYVLEGCLIPLIGMYPTLIILLVTLNKSHCATNFTYTAKLSPGSPVFASPSEVLSTHFELSTLTTLSLTGSDLESGSERTRCISDLERGRRPDSSRTIVAGGRCDS
ncbi:hypothetical protein C8Q80DRAFT_293539 [Daedaleopsis nitida]|nr:hypothetical protein C8Q80DRAFT_293539 [Daedaleopsis nitida]